MTAPTHAAGPSASERGIPALEVKGVTVRFGALAALAGWPAAAVLAYLAATLVRGRGHELSSG